jgi:hypothetical protein
MARQSWPAAAVLGRVHDYRRHPGRDLKVPARAWTPAYDNGREVRPGAWVAELTGMLDLAGWPTGMRVSVRKERPHPGVQLRFTDIGGHRFTCFATSTPKAGSSQTWNCATAAGPGARTGSAARRTPACGTSRCTASPRTRCDARSSPWPGPDRLYTLLALTGPERRWEPRRLRLRLFAAAGRIVRGGRRLRLRLAARWPWATVITAGLTRLGDQTPGCPARPVTPR